jgi:hypothetical protein
MLFYRGISIPRHETDAVIAKIRSQGLRAGDGRRPMLAPDLKPILNTLWGKPSINWTDTRPDVGNLSWVCACGEVNGALYYACSHNKSAQDDTPILITFEVDISEAIVDGGDFLYTAFQLGDPKRSRPILEQLFGKAVLRYAERAWLSAEQRERMAICDLAVQDAAVALAHASNWTVIGGRRRTRFRSAFLVRTPVAPERIVRVRIVDSKYELPEAKVSLNDIRDR